MAIGDHRLPLRPWSCIRGRRFRRFTPVRMIPAPGNQLRANCVSKRFLVPSIVIHAGNITLANHHPPSSIPPSPSELNPSHPSFSAPKIESARSASRRARASHVPNTPPPSFASRTSNRRERARWRAEKPFQLGPRGRRNGQADKPRSIFARPSKRPSP